MALGWRDQYTRYREFYLNILNLYKQKADLRAFLEIILSLTTVTIFTLFAIKPTVITIIGLVREIEEKKTTLAALEQKVQSLEAAGNLYVQNQDVVPIVDSAISTLPSPDLISKQLLGLSGKYNVEIMGISVGQVTIIGTGAEKKGKSDFKPLPGNANEMAFSVSIRGDYPSIISFLRGLENLRLATKADLVSINSANTEEGRVIVAVINGRIPFLGAKK